MMNQWSRSMVRNSPWNSSTSRSKHSTPNQSKLQMSLRVQHTLLWCLRLLYLLFFPRRLVCCYLIISGWKSIKIRLSGWLLIGRLQSSCWSSWPLLSKYCPILERHCSWIRRQRVRRWSVHETNLLLDSRSQNLVICLGRDSNCHLLWLIRWTDRFLSWTLTTWDHLFTMSFLIMIPFKGLLGRGSLLSQKYLKDTGKGNSLSWVDRLDLERLPSCLSHR